MPSSARRTAMLLVAVAALAAGVSSAGPTEPPSAILSPYAAGISTERFRTFDGSGAPLLDSTWRVVTGTGNCCENYLAATAAGRLLDMGGDWPRFSDDGGLTWTQVSTPLQNLPGQVSTAGEGAIVAAPNGDVVAVTWFVYHGDRLLATKYEAATGQWRWKEVVLRNPFYDRPWIAVVPGPITYRGETVPYLTVLKGAWPFKLPYYVSTNGLDYEPLETATGPLRRDPLTSLLEPIEDPSLDHTQPIAAMEAFPLAGGGAAIEPPTLQSCPAGGLLRSTDDGSWHCFSLPGEELPGDTRVGSEGHLHQISVDTRGVNYRLSRDGGASWTFRRAWLPAGLSAMITGPDVGEHDVKVNDALGLAVVGLKTRDAASNLQVVLFVFTTRPEPALSKMVLLGDGDLRFGSSITASGPRMDFMTVAILPDGMIAASFGDASHPRPAIAIGRP